MPKMNPTSDLRPTFAILLGSLVSNLFALAMPLVILHIFDRVIPNQGTATLAVFGMGLAVVAVADFLVRLARMHLLSVRGFRFEINTHRKALERVLCAGANPDLIATETLAQRFDNISRIRHQHGSEMSIAMLDVPFLLIFLVIMTLISPLIGLCASLLVILSLIVVGWHRRRIDRLNADRQLHEDRRSSFIKETFKGVEQIKSYGIEAPMQRRYEKLLSGYAPMSRGMNGLVAFTQGITGTIALIAPVCIAGVGALMVIEGQMTMGALAATVLLTGRIVQPALRLESLIAGERNMRPLIRDLRQMLNAPLRLSGIRPLPRITQISLDRVNWAPSESAPSVLRDITLNLSTGDCIVVDGTNGSGRSSLLAMVAGHKLPTRGTVRVNDELLEEYRPEDLSNRISYLWSRDCAEFCAPAW